MIMLWNLGKSFDSYLWKLLVEIKQKFKNYENIEFLFIIVKKENFFETFMKFKFYLFQESAQISINLIHF